MQFTEIEVFIYLLTVFIFNYKAQFVYVKDRACLKIAKPAYCFIIFGSILVPRFVYLLTL